LEGIDALGDHLVESSVEKVPHFLHLRVSERGARPSALQLMAFLEERTQFTCVAIEQQHHRPHQVRPALGAARLRSVTRDAFSGPHRSATFGGGAIGDVFFAGTRAREHARRSLTLLRGHAVIGPGRDTGDEHDREPGDQTAVRSHYTSHSTTASRSDVNGSRPADGVNSCAKYPWNPVSAMAFATLAHWTSCVASSSWRPGTPPVW